MPFSTIRLRPGVNTQVTFVQNEAGYSTSQLGRFKSGLFQKIGGWVNYIGSVVTGIPRCLHAWEDLNQNGWLGVATTNTLDVIENATTVLNLSPLIFTTNQTPNFSTTNTSPNITIVDAGLTGTPTVLDSINLLTPISVDGLILFGTYQIATVLSSTSYTIVATSNATATVANGGTVPVYTTTNSSSTIKVTLNGHGLSVGQTYIDPIGTTVGGVTILGGYTVTAIIDANNFNIAVAAIATSSTSGSMNSGNARIVYNITLGALGSGTPYGFGPYGSGPYGGTGSAGSIQTGSALASSNWTLDNWGQDLIACPINGAIYYWSPTGSLTTVTPIPGAPLYNTGIFVSAQFQILIAYGSTPVPNGIGYQQDPLFVRWSDQTNFLQWTETATNQAGGQRLYSGSKIIAGYGGPTLDLLWTDLDLWAMSYVGFPNVYGFNKLGDNCGIVGPHAFATLAGQIFWTGQNNFFVCNGGNVSALPCSVWDAFFQNLDQNNISKCVTWSNTPFDEVWFFGPSISGGIGECDMYAKFNTVEQTWDFGSLQRSAAIDQSVLGNPIAATRFGNIYLHETGYDGAGTALNPYMQTGYFALGEAEEFVFVDRIYPDMRWGTYAGPQTATVLFTFYTVNHAGDTPIAHGPYTVTQAIEFITVRFRAKFMSIRIESIDLGSFYRLGGCKYRWAPDGRR